MNVYLVIAKTKLLFKTYGLVGWEANYTDKYKTVIARCFFDAPKEIVYNRYIVENNPDEIVEDTIKHEIAHAIVGEPGHGLKWKAACSITGALPFRKCQATNLRFPPSPYSMYCWKCDKYYPIYKKPKLTHYCNKCGQIARFCDVGLVM